MSISRFLLFSLLIAAITLPATAQSLAETNPAVSPSELSPLSFLNSAYPFSQNLNTEQNAVNPLDRIDIDEYHPRLNQFVLPHASPVSPDKKSHILSIGPDYASQTENLCYTLRSYKVARDDPRSDSTHAAGYTTCQPAARFGLRTTEERVLLTTP